MKVSFKSPTQTSRQTSSIVSIWNFPPQNWIKRKKNPPSLGCIKLENFARRWVSPAWCNWICTFLLPLISLLVAHFTPTNQHTCQSPTTIHEHDVKCVFFSLFSSRSLREISNLRGFLCSFRSMQMMHNNNRANEWVYHSTYLLQYRSDVL